MFPVRASSVNTSSFSNFVTTSIELVRRVCRAVVGFFQAVIATIRDCLAATWNWTKRRICCCCSKRNGVPIALAVVTRSVGQGSAAAGARPVDVIQADLMIRNDMPNAIHASVAINRAALARVPRPFDVEAITYIATHANPPVELNELLTRFDTELDQMGNADILYNDQGTNISKLRARQQIEATYLNFIRDNVSGGGDEYKSQVAKQMQHLLKAVIFELRKPEISAEKKREALENLASAAEHCPPRRNEEALKVYRKLSNQMETIDEIVLQLVQYVKEDLYRNYYSLSREPVQTLNYIRRLVGRERGLDTSAINLADPYINLNDARSPDNPRVPHITREEFLEVFDRIFTPSNALGILKGVINEKIARDNEFAAMLGLYIEQEVVQLQREGVCTEADVVHLPHPYQHDYEVKDKAFHLTDDGIRFLLVRLGTLVPVTANAHIVHMGE